VRTRLGANLISIYGATETSMVATAPAHAIADVPGAVGYVLPGIAVEAVDDRHTPLPLGREGRLRVRSEYAVSGYLGDPDGTEQAFRDGWFYPGDIGSVTAEGLLVVSGREKAIINLGGDKISPERIETELAGSSGVADVAVAGIPNSAGVEEIHVAVVPTGDYDEAALRGRCRAKFPLDGAKLHILRIDAVPRNEMGKVDRRKLIEMISEGEG
jgi:acyl-CoA synthetase (AMP-forming)/AMP-acid ligase II